MEKPVLSPDFTIDDIHKLREYHYELTKDMKPQEKMDFYNEGGRAFLKEMEERKHQFEELNILKISLTCLAGK